VSEPAPNVSVVKELGPAGILALAWTVFPPLGSVVLYVYMNTTGEWLRGHEAAGIVLYIAGFAFLAGLGLLPTYASAILGGWAFGFSAGFPAAMAGFALGALVGYTVGTLVSGDLVVRMVDRRPKVRAVCGALVGGGAGKTFGIVTLLRVPPNSPFALTNLALASVKVPLWTYLGATLVGMAPRTAAMVWIGGELQGLLAEDAAKAEKPTWLIVGGIVSVVAVALVIGSLANRALNRMSQPS
jgi:uncharacterized membrane protein YdjX (TVP38/TMEM64 family)